MDSFAYTVKDNRVDSTDYIPFFDNMEKKGCIVVCKYAEKDSKGKLHYHGIVKIPANCYRKSLCLKGLSMKLVNLFNEEGWLEYCKKDQHDSDTDDTDIINKLKKPLFSSCHI